jgi:hypothetical protein
VFSKWWNRLPAGLRQHEGVLENEGFSDDASLTVSGKMPETTGWKPVPPKLCILKTRPKNRDGVQKTGQTGTAENPGYPSPSCNRINRRTRPKYAAAVRSESGLNRNASRTFSVRIIGRFGP